MPGLAKVLVSLWFNSICRGMKAALKLVTPPFRSVPGKPNQRKGQNEKFMNFAHFCEFWCFLRKTSTIHIELFFPECQQDTKNRPTNKKKLENDPPTTAGRISGRDGKPLAIRDLELRCPGQKLFFLRECLRFVSGNQSLAICDCDFGCAKFPHEGHALSIDVIQFFKDGGRDRGKDSQFAFDSNTKGFAQWLRWLFSDSLCSLSHLICYFHISQKQKRKQRLSFGPHVPWPFWLKF